MKNSIWLLLFLCSCIEVPDELQINAKISLDDECLLCFPECASSEEFSCVDPEGAICEGCRVGCLGGVELTCETEGARCWNYALGERTEMPVVCVDRK